MPPSAMKPLIMRVPKDLLRQATLRLLMMVGHVPMPLGADNAIMVKSIDSLLTA